MTTSPAVAAFIDIDQTLMFSSTAVTRLGIDDGELLTVETIKDAPSGFVHRDLPGTLATLTECALVVPSTTRSLVQYERVELFAHLDVTTAIVANGALILIDGRVDNDWSRIVADRMQSGGAPVGQIADIVSRSDRGKVPGRVYIVESRFICVVMANGDDAQSLLASLTEAVAETGWSASHQGKKIYLMPDAVSKGAAADEVARRYGIRAVTAAGDSVLDIDMLQRADLAIVPRHAASLTAICRQLSPLVTDAIGPKSSVEIAERMIAFAGQPRSGVRQWTLERG
jgi:hypothetical protein